MRRAAALAVVGLSAIGSAQAASAPDMTQKSIEIPPEALRVALQKFGEIEGLHMVFLTEDVQDRNTFGARGSLTPAAALGQVLRGTGLTYQFLDANTVIIFPAGLAQGAPVEPNQGSGPADNAEKRVNAPVIGGTRVPQVTITAVRPSEAQNLEYFRLLAAMSRSDYKRLVKTLQFVDSGTVTFRGFQAPRGQHKQSAAVDGIVLWRVFNITKGKIDRRLEAYNGNSYPVFLEIDSGTTLGNGAYAALAPGDRAVWTWDPMFCSGGPIGGGMPGGWIRGGTLQNWGCADYAIQPGTFRLRMLKGSG